MQMLPSFPAISEVTTGQVLSSTTLNSYHEGLRYLLGISKERRGVQRATTVWTTLGTNTVMYSGYAPLIGWTVTYDLWFKGGSWSWQIQVQDGSGAWQTRASGSGSGDSHVSGNADIGPNPNLVQNRVYPWRVLGSGTSAAGAVWSLTIVPSSVSGWVSPPTFVDGAVSSATDLNKLRADLNALNASRGMYGVPSVSAGQAGWGDKGWLTIYRGSFRWVPGLSMYCSLETKGWIANDGETIEWQIHLNPPIRDGEYWSSTSLYTKYLTKSDLAGEYKRWETVIPAATFGALTPGTIYSIVYILFIEIPGGHNQDGDSITAQRPIMHRIMPYTPQAGWPTLTQWSEGDYVTAARLNAISTGLTNLYVGGANALRPEVPVIGSGTNPVMHVHQRPWLVVRANPGSDLKVWYPGEVGSYTESFTVKAQAEGIYTSIYLDQFRPLTYGSRYLLEGGTWSSEADEAYTG